MDFLVELCDACGKQYRKVLLKDVLVNTKLLKDGFHLTSDSNRLYVVQYKDKKELLFNVKIDTDKSFLLRTYLCWMNACLEIGAALQTSEDMQSMNDNLAHKQPD